MLDNCGRKSPRTRDDTHPEHWHFHSEAAAELDLQLKRFKAMLESLAADIAAAETSRSDNETLDVVYRRHVARAAARLVRVKPIAIGADCQIFVSYKSDDQSFAEEVRTKLVAKGCRVFLAAASIDTGWDWEESIFDALRACTLVLFLISQRSRASEWCHYEIGAARALGKEVHCVLRHVGPADLPAALKRFQGVEVQTTRQLNRFIKTIVERTAQ